MEVKEVNLVLAGIGGQGTILISDILGNAAIAEGLRVRGAEVLGMAQRGGSVMSLLRLGSDVLAPLPPEGKGIILAMEPSEALRNIKYLAEGGTAIINSKKVIPPAVFLGQTKYGDLKEIINRIKQVAEKVIMVNALDLAEKAGTSLASNIVMLGALIASGEIPLKPDTIRQVIDRRFSGKLIEINLRAFELGLNSKHKKC